MLIHFSLGSDSFPALDTVPLVHSLQKEDFNLTQVLRGFRPWSASSKMETPWWMGVVETLRSSWWPWSWARNSVREEGARDQTSMTRPDTPSMLHWPPRPTPGSQTLSTFNHHIYHIPFQWQYSESKPDPSYHVPEWLPHNFLLKFFFTSLTFIYL